MPRKSLPPRCSPRCALFRLARELNPEPGHAFQVRKNAVRLFEALAPLHGLPADALRLLEAAALLHDIGQAVEVKDHHKHSRDLILSRRWPGLEERDRAIVACVARYHRGKHPDPSHKAFRELGKDDRQLVRQLAGLVRVADGLDRGHAASVKAIRAVITPDAVTLQVVQRNHAPLDLVGALRKAGLLVEVFGRSIGVVSAV